MNQNAFMNLRGGPRNFNRGRFSRPMMPMGQPMPQPVPQQAVPQQTPQPVVEPVTVPEPEPTPVVEQHIPEPEPVPVVEQPKQELEPVPVDEPVEEQPKPEPVPVPVEEPKPTPQTAVEQPKQELEPTPVVDLVPVEQPKQEEEKENIKLLVENKPEVKQDETKAPEIINNDTNIKHNIQPEVKPEIKVEEVKPEIKVEEVKPEIKVEEPQSQTELEDEHVMDFNHMINVCLDELMAWYDGSDRNVFQSSIIACNPSKRKDIFVWRDKSRKYNHSTSFSKTDKPIYIGNTSPKVKNGNTSIEFNNKNGMEMGFEKYKSDFCNANCYSLFIVFNCKETNTDSTVWSDNNGNLTVTIDGNTKTLKFSTPQSTKETIKYNVTTDIKIENDEWKLLTVMYDGSKPCNADKFRVRLNNNDVKLNFNDDVSNSIDNIKAIAIGMNNFGETKENWFNGFIGEAILYKKVLNTKSCNQLESYLNTKWDL